MSLTTRRMLILVAGAVAGLLAWPLSELLLGVQTGFPSYLTFIVASGALFGGFFGLAFGTIDGITGGIAARKWTGFVLGAVFGIVAGGVGALAGQAIYLAIGQAVLVSPASRSIGLPLARGIGWAVMGTIIGVAEGARLRSGQRAAIGALGGFVGGLAGGVIIEYGSLAFGSAGWVRPAASVVLGLLIAAGFAVIERGFLLGSLVLVTGPLRGREYPLPPGRTTIGRSVGDTISLVPYDGLSKRHAVITGRKSGLTLESGAADAEVRVNEETVERVELKFDDVIDVGKARFVLKTP